MKLHYTTGEAAAICDLSMQTIIRAIDRGDLPGFRIPGSTHRRIPGLRLREWMERHGIPLDRLEPCPADSLSS